MTKPRVAISLNPQIRAQATAWLLKFSDDEVDPKGRQEFLDWLRASPEHVRAYLRVVAFWQDAPHIRGQPPVDVAELLRLSGAQTNVVPFDDPLLLSPGADSRPKRRRIATRLLAWAASVLLFTASLSVWFYLQRGVYSTAVGEQRTVNLSDGSTVTINALSKVRIAYSPAERRVQLLKGQALFNVARNSTRPFIVQTDGTLVKAVGTQFDVYKNSAGTIVTVVEGRVVVMPPMPVRVDSDNEEPGTAGIDGSSGSSGAPASIQHRLHEVFVAAGEQAIVTAQAASKSPHVDVTAATAWTQGLLIFDHAPLSDVVREFNRQNSRALVLVGQDLPRLEISGTFPASGDERIVRFLMDRFGVKVDEDGREIRISPR